MTNNPLEECDLVDNRALQTAIEGALKNALEVLPPRRKPRRVNRFRESLTTSLTRPFVRPAAFKAPTAPKRKDRRSTVEEGADAAWRRKCDKQIHEPGHHSALCGRALEEFLEEEGRREENGPPKPGDGIVAPAVSVFPEQQRAHAHRPARNPRAALETQSEHDSRDSSPNKTNRTSSSLEEKEERLRRKLEREMKRQQRQAARGGRHRERRSSSTPVGQRGNEREEKLWRKLEVELKRQHPRAARGEHRQGRRREKLSEDPWGKRSSSLGGKRRLRKKLSGDPGDKHDGSPTEKRAYVAKTFEERLREKLSEEATTQSKHERTENDFTAQTSVYPKQSNFQERKEGKSHGISSRGRSRGVSSAETFEEKIRKKLSNYPAARPKQGQLTHDSAGSSNGDWVAGNACHLQTSRDEQSQASTVTTEVSAAETFEDKLRKKLSENPAARSKYERKAQRREEQDEELQVKAGWTKTAVQTTLSDGTTNTFEERPKKKLTEKGPAAHPNQGWKIARGAVSSLNKELKKKSSADAAVRSRHERKAQRENAKDFAYAESSCGSAESGSGAGRKEDVDYEKARGGRRRRQRARRKEEVGESLRSSRNSYAKEEGSAEGCNDSGMLTVMRFSTRDSSSIRDGAPASDSSNFRSLNNQQVQRDSKMGRGRRDQKSRSITSSAERTKGTSAIASARYQRRSATDITYNDVVQNHRPKNIHEHLKNRRMSDLTIEEEEEDSDEKSLSTFESTESKESMNSDSKRLLHRSMSNSFVFERGNGVISWSDLDRALVIAENESRRIFDTAKSPAKSGEAPEESGRKAENRCFGRDDRRVSWTELTDDIERAEYLSLAVHNSEAKEFQARKAHAVAQQRARVQQVESRNPEIVEPENNEAEPTQMLASKIDDIMEVMKGTDTTRFDALNALKKTNGQSEAALVLLLESQSPSLLRRPSYN